jgi:Domain of unknown function (DUF4331)
MKRSHLAAGALGLAVAAVALSVLPAGAADHLEAPLVKKDGRTDINDLYVFESPTNQDNTVLVMTVNPLAGVQSPTTFKKDLKYQFTIDNDGDADPDLKYTVRYGLVKDDGSQKVTVLDNSQRSIGSGRTGQTIALSGGGSAWSGTSDDPFFFDLAAFNDQVKGAGGPRTFCDAATTNFFAGANVSSIVLEVPDSKLVGSDGTDIGVAARTVQGNRVIDRMGRPAIATVLIPDGKEDRFNATRPPNDRAAWSDEVVDALLKLSGLDGSPYSQATAQTIADLLLPDVLTYDTAASGTFVPDLNGRTLADDVIDFELFVVTGGLEGSAVLDSDCVDANDVPFPGTFPYVAPANT